MEYLLDTLLRETVTFLEVCQDSTFKNKINVDTYSTLTNFKINFIETVLKEEKEKIFIDKELRSRLNKLFINDKLLNTSYKSAVV